MVLLNKYHGICSKAAYIEMVTCKKTWLPHFYYSKTRPGSTGVLGGAKHPQTKLKSPSVKAVIWHFIADLANYPVRYDLRSGNRFLFQHVFAVLSIVSNHRHIC